MAAATTTKSMSSTATTTAVESMLTSSSPRTPPWAEVVKGGDSSCEASSNSLLPENLTAVEQCKKTAWKNLAMPTPQPPPPSPPPPSGGDHGGVMAGVSWPALSDVARLKTTSSFDSSKSNPNVSNSNSIPLSQGPVNSHSQPKTNAMTNQNSNMNGGALTRQRSIKRGGNRHGGFARGPPPPPPLPTFPVPEIAQSSFTKGVGPGPDSSSRDPRPSGGFVSHSNSSNEHSNHRNSNRRGNFWQVGGRGDGRNNYHGGRRDQDRGNYDSSSSSSPHGRGGARGRPHRPHGRGFMGPLVQGAPPFAPPPPVRPYGNTMVYPDPALVYYIPSLPMDSFTGMPYFTGPPPPSYLVMSDPLRVSIINQIEYYFSDDNLIKDGFLKSKMDENGWVPITLIASFPRVQNLTNSVPFILECLKGSTIVEVQGDKVRRAEDWSKWITFQQPPLNSHGTNDKSSSSNQTASLEENQGNTSNALIEEELTNNLQALNIDGSTERVC